MWSRINRGTWATAGLLSLLTIGSVFVPAWSDTPNQYAPEETLWVDIKSLTADSPGERRRAAESFRRKRKELIWSLMGSLWRDPNDHSKGIYPECAYVLGTLWAHEAIPMLVEALPYDSCGIMGGASDPPGSCYPVLSALVPFGKLVVPDVLTLIGTTDTELVRSHACSLLYLVLGSKTAVVSALRDAEMKARDDQQRSRLRHAQECALKRFSDGTPTTQGVTK